MKSVKLTWVWTGWMLVCLLSFSSAHSEDIHDVRNHQESCTENLKWISSLIKPGIRDVYEDLWVQNLDLAEQTLKLPFLQHMQLGDLQADNYSVFMIQDIFYLAKVTDMLEEISNKPDIPADVGDFLKGRFKSYNSFKESMLNSFNLNGVNDITMIPAMKDYLENYKRIMDEEKPIMFAVGLLPCNRLWVWLANQLKIGYGNAYWTWKKSNMDGHPEKFRDILNKYLQKDKDFERAKKIFRDQMENEFNFFKASVVK